MAQTAIEIWHQIVKNADRSMLKNLLDKDYQQIFGYGTPGRSGNIGLRYRFN